MAAWSALGDGPHGAALLLIDVQRGFDDPAWGRRNNPACEENVARLLTRWRTRSRPVVFVRHDSRQPNSPLAGDSTGNGFKDVITGEPDLLVTKHVNSAFYGHPDLHHWLSLAQITGVVIAGITTNHCCETTARMAGNLGYRTLFALDATHTFDRQRPGGRLFSADELRDGTAVNLDGEFATVLSTAELLGLDSPDPSPPPEPCASTVS
jgi:nicotinamidase-related amidase